MVNEQDVSFALMGLDTLDLIGRLNLTTSTQDYERARSHLRGMDYTEEEVNRFGYDSYDAIVSLKQFGEGMNLHFTAGDILFFGTADERIILSNIIVRVFDSPTISTLSKSTILTMVDRFLYIVGLMIDRKINIDILYFNAAYDTAVRLKSVTDLQKNT